MMGRHDDPADDAPIPSVRRHPTLPSPTLRGRVLAAIDDVLLEGGTPSVVTALEAMPWAVAATLAAGLLLVPSLAAAARGTTAPTVRAVPSLAERARAAGAAADLLPPSHSPSSCTTLASMPPGVDDGDPEPVRLHPLVFRRALEGEF